jgi:hypothetical protein
MSSSLSKLAESLKPKQQGVMFSEKFKTKVVQLEQSMHFNTDRSTSIHDNESLNYSLEKDIKNSGDHFGGRNSSVSCLMTRWDMHLEYESFKILGDLAIEAAENIPLALRTNEDGSPNPIEYYVQETWGLVYNKGHVCKAHTHWPSVWSYTYCVSACDDCAPLCFPTNDGHHAIAPRTGQLIIFPSWVNHFVPEHQCDHERIMISGNLDVVW